MTAKKTLLMRERELQGLLATPAGKKELEELESRYREGGANARATNTSVITYLLVFERNAGLITG